MYLVLCNEYMHISTWMSFPVNDPKYKKYGMLKWKLALNAPNALHGQKLRPIKPAGVPDLKPKAMKTPPNKRLKFSTDTAVKCSPLSNIENNLTKIGSLFNTKI
jgi:hypothetical protein